MIEALVRDVIIARRDLEFYQRMLNSMPMNHPNRSDVARRAALAHRRLDDAAEAYRLAHEDPDYEPDYVGDVGPEPPEGLCDENSEDFWGRIKPF